MVQLSVSHSAGGRIYEKGTLMDKGKNGKGASQGSRVGELAAIAVIIACLVLVCAELVVNVSREMKRNTASGSGSFIVTSIDAAAREEGR